jgi:hypothetical protein
LLPIERSQVGERPWTALDKDIRSNEVEVELKKSTALRYDVSHRCELSPTLRYPLRCDERFQAAMGEYDEQKFVGGVVDADRHNRRSPRSVGQLHLVR